MKVTDKVQKAEDAGKMQETGTSPSKSSKRASYLAKNTALLALGSLGAKLISFFLVPLYTDVLSTAEYGSIDLLATIATVLVPILTLDMAEGILRFSLDADADHDRILTIGLTSLGGLALLGGALLPLLVQIESLGDYAVYIYLYLLSLGFSQLFQNYLRGTERLLLYAISYILQTAALAAFNILFLVGFHWGVKGYFTAFILAHFLSGLFAVLFGGVLRALPRLRFDKTLWRRMAVYSVCLIPNSFMWWIMNSSDRIMVTYMVSAAANGVYALSYKLPTLLSTFSTIFTKAWLYSAIREEKAEDKTAYHEKIFQAMCAFSVIVGCGLMLILKPFMHSYVAEEYYGAWQYTPYLIIGFVLMTLGTFLSTQYQVHKNSRGFLMSGLCGAVVNILLNFLLIPLFQVSGAALATCISYGAVFLYRFFDTRRYMKLHIFSVRHVTAFLLLCASAVVALCSLPYERWILAGILLLEVVLYRTVFIEIVRGVWLKVKAKK